MIERSPNQTETAPRSRDRLRQLGASLAGSIVLISACSESPEPNKPLDSQSTAKPEVAADTPFLGPENFKDIDGDCKLPSYADFQNGRSLSIEAPDCLKAYSSSDIAAVNYALEPEQARQLAENIETTIAEVSNGLLQPNVELILPNKAAKKFYHEKNQGDCVQTDNLDAYSSYAAAATMPELNSYEKIIGFNQYPDCKGTDFGVAYSIFSRYSEILDVDSYVEKAQNNNNSYSGSINDSGVEIGAIINPTLVGTHEILHSFGLGHSGVVYPKTSNIGTIASNRTLDLSDYLQSAQYMENNAYDVMGQVARGELSGTPELNSIQTHLLEWPQRALDKPTTTKPIDLKDRTAKFYQTSDDSSIALLQLTSPLELPASHRPGYSKKINRIILTPALKYVAEGDNAVTVRIYGSTQTGDVVDLGGFYEAGDYSLAVNDGLLQIDLNAAQADISYQQPLNDR